MKIFVVIFTTGGVNDTIDAFRDQERANAMAEMMAAENQMIEDGPGKWTSDDGDDDLVVHEVELQ